MLYKQFPVYQQDCPTDTYPLVMPFFSPGSWFGARLPLEGGGDDLCGEVEVVPEVLDALVGQTPVEVSPGELLLHIAAGLKRSQGFDDLNIEL